jgi:hypothetical protein
VNFGILAIPIPLSDLNCKDLLKDGKHAPQAVERMLKGS